MIYPYLCGACGPFEVSKRMAEADLAEPCPVCGEVIENLDYAAKQIGGYLSTEGNWTGGKIVPQLPATHPDYNVTSERQMERVYQKHGISMDTGKFESKEAQIKATVPRHKRTGHIPQAVGGLDS